jgi:Glycosyl hydrolase-like 10
MVGQGRPSTGRMRFALRGGLPVRILFRLAAVVPLALAAQALAAEPTMHLRVGWGGGTERQWHGSISINTGTLALERPLGIIADSPGSIWASSDKQIEIRERSIRAYDGVDLSISAPLDARLTISLEADAEPRPVTSEVALSELAVKLHRRTLDAQGNQLLVRRGPGDSLRVTTDRDPLIFAPGEIWKLEVNPRLLPVAAGTTVYLKSRLVAARAATEFWSEEHTIKTTETESNPASIPLEVKLPEAEGVYDLVIEASERGPLRWPKPIVERRVQVIVLAGSGGPLLAASAAERSVMNTTESQNWTQVLEIDPTNPHWYDRFKSLRLSMLITVPLGKESGPTWQGPLGSGNSQIVSHPLGKLVQLAPASKGADASWEAYPLAIAKPGMPHLLEVEYPSDVPQTLGISIIEPNAAGAVAPIELDSGFDASGNTDSGSPRWLKHRLLFWPRTSSPVVLLTNRRDGSRAAYGKLRLYSSPQRLRRAFPAEDRPERLLAGYLDRPLFTANFSASESLDAFTGRSLTDWQTFHEGATRLADYLNYTGRNGLMMAVLAEGSTIYPSKLLEPTDRFDSGAFFDLGQDPTRKDVLEMLLRVFDREQLSFIPMLQFSTPLPELEALLREGGRDSVGLQWVGRDGAAWTDVNESHRGMAPYYNVLDPRVQEAMLRVIRELAERCAGHPAVSGLAIELSAFGFAQLPGETWGLDDRTIARFEQDAQLSVPGVGAGRFAERAQFVTGPGRRAWLIWRSDALADFYRRVQRELAAIKPEARLYLAPTNPLKLPELERELRPGLPSRGRIDEALLAVGIRPDAYRNEKGIVLLRGQRFSLAEPLAAQAIDIETSRSSDWDAAIHAQQSPGTLFFHEPQRLRLASFDAKSPFGKDKTYTWLISQVSPSQQDNRRRFVHSLASLDSEVMFDGGWLLPLGQEPALVDLVAAYRQLPARRFETVADSIEPLTVRALHAEGRTYAYLVNDSPWPIRAGLQVDGPAGVRPEELGGQHRMDTKGPLWTLDLEPYDLAVVRFNTQEVRLSSPQVVFGVEASRSLAASIRDLHSRRVMLESPPPAPWLSNPGFELPARGGQIPGWSWTAGPGDKVRLDINGPREGRQALRLQTSAAAITVRSEPFAAPQTGRLAVSIWLKSDDAGNPPRLWLVLEGTPEGRPFHRTAALGEGQGAAPIPNKWKQFIFTVDDLPPDVPSQLRFRIDVLGPADVSVDDVQLFDLVFNETEKIQLSKIIALADFQLNSGRLGDCLYELEGYWPRLLNSKAPLAALPLVANPQAAPPPKDSPEKSVSRPGVLDRIKDAWKR